MLQESGYPVEVLAHFYRARQNEQRGVFMESERLLNYSAELSLLAQLFQNKLISEQEYQKVKQKLMKEYRILSDLTAMTA